MRIMFTHDSSLTIDRVTRDTGCRDTSSCTIHTVTVHTLYLSRVSHTIYLSRETRYGTLSRSITHGIHYTLLRYRWCPGACSILCWRTSLTILYTNTSESGNHHHALQLMLRKTHTGDTLIASRSCERWIGLYLYSILESIFVLVRVPK